MINNPKEDALSSDHHHHEKAKAPPTPSSSSQSQWLRLKDPRIVRVSRAFGGKDRHSKVCTIRGLRDRRVRLSVPTAIHLYDLQDRLGLSQPSKVVDWLLNAAKHEIDELPPLPVHPGSFTLGYPSLAASNNDVVDVSTSSACLWKPKAKEEIIVNARSSHDDDEEDDDNKQGSKVNDCPSTSTTTTTTTTSAHVLPNNNSLLPRPNLPSFLGLLNTMPFGYQWENNSSSSGGDGSQLGSQGFVNQADNVHSINVVPFTSTLGGSQILVCPPGAAAAAQSYFPSHVAAMEMDPRQISHYQQVMSSSSHHHHHQNLSSGSVINPSHQHHHHHLMMNQLGKPFSLARITPKLFHSHKDQDFPSK